MRLKITILFIVICTFAKAQDNAAESYNDPLNFKTGDAIQLNEPTNDGKYRSVYYTYEAAKNIRPDLKPYSTEKVYLSSQFYKAPFTVVEIKGTEATLAYGIMKNFAILDLELAIRSGEVGNKENMAPIWLIEEIKKGDKVQLRKASGAGLFKSVYFTPKFAKKRLGIRSSENIYLTNTYEGDIFKVVNKWDQIALLANDTVKEIAFIDLKSAIENEELEIRPEYFASKVEIVLAEENPLEKNSEIDSTLYFTEIDTVEKVSFLDRLGIGIYLAPFVEGSPKESSSINYGAAIGVILKDKWQFGAYIQGYGGSFSERLIFPNSFALEYAYTGLFAAYPLLKKGGFTLLAEGKVGVGEAAWNLEESNDVLDSDNFAVFNPKIGIEYKPSRIGVLNISIGYRFVQGFDLAELSSSELNNFNLSAMLKIGRFNKIKDE